MKRYVTIIEEEERFVGYNCIYRYETHEVQLEYDISTEMWTILSDKCHLAEQKQLNTLIERVNKLSRAYVSSTLDKQIQYILRLFDDYFVGQYKVYVKTFLYVDRKA
jgi:hypothetical protein